MKRRFMVIRSRGRAWVPSRPMDEQAEWESHARFMDGLVEEGFIVLGGPLEGTPEVLLIVEAKDAGEIRTRLAADPWSVSGLLTVSRIDPWRIRLGTPG